MEKTKIEIDGQIYDIEIYRSIRRTISLEVGEDGIKLRIPRRLSDTERDLFLEKHVGWLKKKLKARNRLNNHFDDENNQPDENKFTNKENEFTDRKNETEFSNDENKFENNENDMNIAENQPRKSNFPPYDLLTSKEKSVIRQTFEERVAYHAQIMGITYGRISVRDQKTRWGSCSSKGNLNFNYRLYYMPQHLMDYVIIHELSHRRQMNHSKLFWAEVQKYCPNYKKCVNELKNVFAN
jgi:predicted metal-dependent hydrolase